MPYIHIPKTEDCVGCRQYHGRILQLGSGMGMATILAAGTAFTAFYFDNILSNTFFIRYLYHFLF